MTSSSYGGHAAAPPPTPSTQPNNFSTSAAADALSRLLHRLPPTLCLPSRLSPPTPPTTSPPLISFSDQNPNLPDELLSSASQLGFFQLVNHSIPSQLARSAELESLSLFDLPRDQKLRSFSKNWPLGYEDDDDQDGDGDGTGESFCFDLSSEATELSSLREFARSLEKLGLEVVESLSCAVGFENPFREGPTRFSSLMWISDGGKKQVCHPDQSYPYVVSLQYQIRCLERYSLLADSGCASVSPELDSVLVTVGDIAQAWSNGKLKKVRGRPVMAARSALSDDESRSVTMTLLLTLPADSTVSPLFPTLMADVADRKDNEDEEDEGNRFCSLI